MTVGELPFKGIIESIQATLWMWDMAPRPGSPKGYLWHNTKLPGVKAYPVAADDNSFYVSIRHTDPSGTIMSHDINSVNVEWIKSFDSALTTRAAFVDNFLLISTRSGGIHFIDKYSGGSLWNLAIGSKLETAPALGINGIVAFHATVYIWGISLENQKKCCTYIISSCIERAYGKFQYIKLLVGIDWTNVVLRESS